MKRKPSIENPNSDKTALKCYEIHWENGFSDYYSIRLIGVITRETPKYYIGCYSNLAGEIFKDQRITLLKSTFNMVYSTNNRDTRVRVLANSEKEAKRKGLQLLYNYYSLTAKSIEEIINNI